MRVGQSGINGALGKSSPPVKLFDFLFRQRLAVRLFFVAVPFLVELPPLMSYVLGFQKIGLIWAALILIYDLCTRREIFKARYLIFIIPFLICFLIADFLNQGIHFRANLEEWMYATAALLVLYPAGEADRKLLERDLSAICYTMAALTAAVGTVSLAMFFMKYNPAVTVAAADHTYQLGVEAGRLVGLYRNSIYPTAALGLLCAAVPFFMKRTQPLGIKIFLIYAVAVNFVVVVLQYSRAIWGGLAAAALFCGIVFLLRALRGKARAKLRLAAIVGIAVVCVLLLAVGTRAAMSGLTGTDLTRTSSSDDISTGRFKVWAQGIEYWTKQPVFGYGPYTLGDELVGHDALQQKNVLVHFHNIFVQTIVSLGAVGLILFAALLGCAAWFLLRRLWRLRETDTFPLLAALLALLLFLLAINMFDTTILYMAKQSGYVFWIFFGYAVALAGNGKRFKWDVLYKLSKEQSNAQN